MTRGMAAIRMNRVGLYICRYREGVGGSVCGGEEKQRLAP